MDLKKIGSDLGLDMDELFEIMELFLDTAENEIEKYREACENNDSSAAAAVSHSLKGSSGNLGFTEFSECSRIAEQKARANDLEGCEGIVGNLLKQLKIIENSLNK